MSGIVLHADLKPKINNEGIKDKLPVLIFHFILLTFSWSTASEMKQHRISHPSSDIMWKMLSLLFYVHQVCVSVAYYALVH